MPFSGCPLRVKIALQLAVRVRGVQNPLRLFSRRGGSWSVSSGLSPSSFSSTLVTSETRLSSVGLQKQSLPAGNLFSEGVIDRPRAISVVAASFCQLGIFRADQLLAESGGHSFTIPRPNQGEVMATTSSVLMRVESPPASVYTLGLGKACGQPICRLHTGRSPVVATGGTKLFSCNGKVTGSMKNRGQAGRNMFYHFSLFGLSGSQSASNPFANTERKDFHSSSSAVHSAGAAPDVSFDGVAPVDRTDSSAVSPEQKILGDRILKLVSGSCYLPHPAKEETGGEDAHFICVDEQAIGVADGVGGWADLGIDAGQYARELMSHSVAAIQQEPKGSIDPARVLEKAHSSTKARGSSTACIVALTDQGVHAVNLGDSGFIVVRDGCTIFRSPVQQHDFNFTYQLESGNRGDLPSSGQVFTIPVAPGDVVVAGTDGLFDNLYNSEVTAVIVHAIRAGLGPQVTAQKIAALARQRAQDQNRQTPFSTAAQEAGFRYYGGKLDDITVVVSYITSSST
ncbi:probable protein phosphatase 2C 80 isoform X1 [Nymphaea colorata]|nr:probable protein phosphatase 2C 80 isoform X1 [Nymphaea colorata]